MLATSRKIAERTHDPEACGSRIRRAVWVGALLAGGIGLLVPAVGRALDLEGTWYVLVHYQDSATHNPEAWRWEDRVWRLAREGEDLEWTEWPIVVLDDESGRFEPLGGNRRARVLAAWEPDEQQLADIRNGIQVNSRGVKIKTLRLSEDGETWRSTGSAAPGSAVMLSYVEDWSIADASGLPHFRRDDSLSGGMAESMDGSTEYRTEEVRTDGQELAGSYQRDGTQVGRFRMIRSGATERPRGSGLTQQQRLMQMFSAQVGLNLSADQIRALSEGRVAAGAEVPVEERATARRQIRESVEQAFRQQDQDPRRFTPQIDSLTKQIEQQIFEEGKSLEEVQRMLGAGELLP
jgi:hypothetical protein